MDMKVPDDLVGAGIFIELDPDELHYVACLIETRLQKAWGEATKDLESMVLKRRDRTNSDTTETPEG